MARELAVFLAPKSIAVIGASRTPEKVGAIVLKNILESKFTRKIYPINPNTDSINDLQCFHDINSLPEIPDLAVIALPAGLVTETLNQLGEKGIKNVVVFSAGFKETGAEGEKLEEELLEVSKKYGLNILGPNCLGFVNNLCPVNVTFGEPVNHCGNLRFISQSGALAASLFDWCKSTGLGFSEFITLGNKTVINENDILQYFQNQTPPTLSPTDQDGLSDVHPIGLYLESILNGEEFFRLTNQLSKRDPIFILKPGKSHAAAKAMQSHTGAIAGEDAVLDAALTQAGVTRCNTLEDFFDFARAFAWEKAPVGPKVAIISNAGGPAVISADAVIHEGLELAEFDDLTREKLTQVLPRSASIFNPVDVLGDALADRIASAAEIILQTDQAHALVVILTPQVMTQIEKTAELIGNLSKKYQKPIFCSFMGGSLVAQGEQKLNEFKIPTFHYPERAIAAIGAMYRFKKQQVKHEEINTSQTLIVQLNLDRPHEIIDNAIKNNQKTLNNIDANDLLLSAGIITPATQIIENLDQAKSFIQSNTWPIVLKLSLPNVLHKTEIGGVVTDISNEEQLELAWEKLRKIIDNQLDPQIREHTKIQIQKEIINGIEIIVGVKQDPTFGPVMLFGAGGTLAELIADRNLHLLPIDIQKAKELVEQSKIFTILKGYRGKPPYALDKLYELIVRLGKLAEALPEVSEIEINPAIVTLNDAFAVDGKVVLKEGETKQIHAPKFHIATTIEHTNLAGKYHYFTFETETPLIYQPGQYVSVKVASTRINAYSIACHDGPNKFSLLIDTSPGGPGSKFFENLKVGEKITYLGPFGVFTLKPDDGAKHLLFLGTGSGCSPLHCMIEAALKEKNITNPITLYFGLRNTSDVFWQEHFQKLSEEHPNFSFKLALSKPDESWHGLSGHITELVDKDFPDASEVSAYLCGNKAMIDQATEILASHGCPKERIYSEKF